MTRSPDPRLFIGLAALALLGGSAAVYSKWGQISEQRAEVAQVEQKVSAASGVRVELEQSEQRLAELRVKLAHLERGVPDYQYVPTMLRELERFGKANGVDVTGIRPGIKPPTAAVIDGSEAPQAYDEMTIEVKGRGQYGDALRFTKALHQFPKIVAARTLSLVPRTDLQSGTASPLLDLTFELKVFVFPQESNTKTPAANVATAALAGGESNG